MKFPLQLHNGEKVSLDLFYPVENDPEDKLYRPTTGGLWLSDFTPHEEYHSPWLEFVYNDPEMAGYHSNPFNYIYEVKEEAKVYQIHSYEDFLRLLKQYPIRSNQNIYMDFEKMAKEWDGLYVSKKGLEGCSNPCIQTVRKYFNEEVCEPPSLKAWDVPSFLVFNLDILIFREERENPHFIDFD
ncbi:hypothetical protein [Aneurinibacillus danicus]|jgi:hypothetical protein|uniref:Uncharacterized protein n=1 Tax=Aneurinibacillus danicus TaxID=267746 RepID=A0A511VCV6_9BACL|nr:hypothetical protein [Aneurinibacillus danicus]GEN36694.1 hypothetical protein ADA01nite_41540 [Aneurinibacillus danicus]